MNPRFLLLLAVLVAAAPLAAQEAAPQTPTPQTPTPQTQAPQTQAPQTQAPLDRAIRQQRPLPADPGIAMRAGRWAEATEAAARLADPLAVKLVTFARLLTANMASTAEIAAFAAENPDWPQPSLLERRRQEALARENDPAVLAAECRRGKIVQLAAMRRCAEATAGTPDGAEFARRAWIGADISDPTAEADFLQRFGTSLSPQDHWARFEAILPDSAIAAMRQAERVAPERRPLAQARLAFRRGDANAAALAAALPPDSRADPWLFLDQAIALREAGQDAAALAMWRAQGEAAQEGVAPEQRGRFWTERHRFARHILRGGDAAGAYALAALPGALPSDVQLDAQFLAGFIALRRLGDPARAIPHFRALVAGSPAALTQSRAWYWLGRAGEGGATDKAAGWPLTFYGQLAALARGETEGQLAERIRAARDPDVPPALAAQVAEREGVRAARILLGWGEPRRAGAFFARMDDPATSPEERAALAQLALRMRLPDAAVMSARRMGREGIVLAESGWPMPVSPPAQAIPVAISLALMRQESNFDVGIVSPAGARGLMQLMPATAQAMAKRLGETTSPAALTTDAAHNMRLGTSYLKDMLDQFSSLPMAIAAYNAGPHRVKAWLTANGDPRSNATAQMELIDWIELIPFNETRNYVQRVLENVAIYRARRGDDTPELMAEWKPR